MFSKSLWQIDIPFNWGSNSVHVDLGSGGNPRNPLNAEKLIAADIHLPVESNLTASADIENKQVDITKTFPFNDESIDSFSAFDVIEHIPRWERREDEVTFPFVNAMNEIFRCLKPGGIFIAVTPCYPKSEAFQDPTHVNIISKNTIYYFSSSSIPDATRMGYGFQGNFKILHNDWLKGGGPFLSNSEFTKIAVSKKSTSFLVLLKYIKRYIKMKFKVKSSHVLWVLQK